MRLQVKSQIHDKEAKKGILDDCGPSALAAALAWASKDRIAPTPSEAVARRVEQTGRPDRQGVLDLGTSFKELVALGKSFGGKVRWAKSWADVVKSAEAGAGLIINVQAPRGYTPAMYASNAWLRRWKKYWAKKDPAKLERGYGHYVAGSFCEDHGWQVADPTMTGVGGETYAVVLTAAEFKALCSSKGEGPFSRLLIVTAPKAKVAPVPAPTPAPAPAPTAPAISVRERIEALRKRIRALRGPR